LKITRSGYINEKGEPISATDPINAVALERRCNNHHGVVRSNNCIAVLAPGIPRPIEGPQTGKSSFPLRVRGGNTLATRFENGTLVVAFKFANRPASAGLEPGQGSWLDRGWRQAAGAATD